MKLSSRANETQLRALDEPPTRARTGTGMNKKRRLTKKLETIQIGRVDTFGEFAFKKGASRLFRLALHLKNETMNKRYGHPNSISVELVRRQSKRKRILYEVHNKRPKDGKRSVTAANNEKREHIHSVTYRKTISRANCNKK